MNNAKELLRKYNINPLAYEKNKSAVIASDKDNTYVIKKRNKEKQELYRYLKSRSFNYYPDILNITEEDNYDIFRYYEEYDIPSLEKSQDLIAIVSILHTKTTHYENTTLDDYKKIYEKIAKKIDDLSIFYNDLNEIIDDDIYMAPSEYLLVRNISKIYSVLDFCSNELDNWYELIKDKKKRRVALIHNNLELSHLIKNEDTILISWDKAKYDIPIYDLYNFYKNEYKNIDFSYLLSIYEKRYPLLEEERILLFILISLPEKIEYTKDEYENTKIMSNLLEYIVKTEEIILPYYANYQKDENN